ncbi:MAG TPA: arginine deiminase-related protein [bacterium]|nr:arginine deiminase-related protein [bacterium]HMW36213.1 arginine deiminase-related protein [bacterium]HNB09581.1 arginine deiminase-related protein [bacterium]HNB55659.1 arginine deiminase-related protein [bacterium]HND76292.1 arginine deiminase-related protein [bacterium]
MNKVYTNAESIDFRLADIPERPEPEKLLMCSPDHFNVTEAINNFMTDTAGQMNQVDRPLAFQQWTNIRFLYEALGYRVHTIRGEVGLEDMVFSANQSFPFWDRHQEKPAVIMSNMRKDKRKGEVPYFQSWYRKQGYMIHELKGGCFESNGDALWFPEKHLIISGFGSTTHHRTDLLALEQVARITDGPVVGIELKHPDFYHLNTTLAIIDKDVCLVYPPGVGDHGMAILRLFFKTIIEVSKEEAYAPNFACNAFSPDGEIVFIQGTCVETIHALEKLGKRVIGVDTSEFIKSGGSVFCMKIKVY